MFVPRAVRLKGVKEIEKPKLPPVKHGKSKTDGSLASKKHSPAEHMRNGITSLPRQDPQREHHDHEVSLRGPRFTTTPITSNLLAQCAAGIALVFTDYAHQDPESAGWLRTRYREVDGEGNFIHLTAILEHPNVASIKPQATQAVLRQAVQTHATDTLELSKNGFFVRRLPSTYPLPFVPHNSFEVVNDDGLTFWDQRTIYVEPHIRHLCKTPAKVAHWLQEYGQIKAKWLPIQAVQTLYNSCAFVVLSGNVTHEDPWKKWRNLGKPEDWKIMTKIEHTKRTEEYLELLERNKLMSKRKKTASFSSNQAYDNVSPASNTSRKPNKKRKTNKGKNAASLDP